MRGWTPCGRRIRTISRVCSLSPRSRIRLAPRRAVLALETALATRQWTRVRNRDRNATYNRMTAAELAAKMPHFNWASYLQPRTAIGLAVGGHRRPARLSRRRRLAARATRRSPPGRSTSPRKLLDAYANELSSPFVQARFDFRGKVLSGQQAMRARWKRGVSEVDGGLGEAAGKLYIARNFKPEAKARIDELIRQPASRRIESASTASSGCRPRPRRAPSRSSRSSP